MLAQTHKIGAPAALVVARRTLIAIGLGRQPPAVHGHLQALVAPDCGHPQKLVELCPGEKVGVTLASTFGVERPLAEVVLEKRRRRRRGDQLAKGKNLIIHKTVAGLPRKELDRRFSTSACLSQRAPGTRKPHRGHDRDRIARDHGPSLRVWAAGPARRHTARLPCRASRGMALLARGYCRLGRAG
jgi:hypothetical protein